MNERVVQFRVGVMVLASIIIAAILLVLFEGFPSIGARPYTIYVAFRNAGGIASGTPVRMNGILIGRATKVDFAKDVGLKMDGGGVVVTCEIAGNRRLNKQEIVRVARTVLGDSSIEFVPSGRDHTAEDELKNGDLIYGESSQDIVSSIANVEGNLSNAFTSIGKTSDEIGLLARRFNELLATNDEQIVRVISKAEQTIETIQKTAHHLDEIVADPGTRDNLKRTLKELPDAVADIRTTMSDLKRTLANADTNLKNLEGITGPLGENGPALVQKIERAAANIDQVVADFSQFSRNLNSSQGSLGRLLNDPQLYEDIAATIRNVNEMTTELKPILRDARAFSDKVSRHPERLGVRGAIFPSSGIK